jgi:tRNA U34 5-carboxymethylaminomethyl modifying enzyme MnmG/GidA
LREQVEEQLEVQAKYAGYIERQQREIDKHAKQERLRLPEDIDYARVDGLSNEARQRLQASGSSGRAPEALTDAVPVPNLVVPLTCALPRDLQGARVACHRSEDLEL